MLQGSLKFGCFHLQSNQGEVVVQDKVTLTEGAIKIDPDEG